MPNENVKPTALANFLGQENQIIRIFTNTGAAFGNQAANANLLRRVRNMGFKGTFEFIYPRRIQDKIQYIFDLPVGFPSIYQSNDSIVFYSLEQHIERYLNCSLPPVQLAMTGASDNYFKLQSKLSQLTPEIIQSVQRFDLEEYAEARGITFNFANFMNAEVFVWFSQYQTNEQHQHFRNTVFHVRDESEHYMAANSGNKFLNIPRHNFTDLQRVLVTKTGKKTIANRPALLTLISAYQNPDIKILPCYGYTLLNFYSPNNLIAIMAGARYAQLRSFSEKPIIIPFFNELDSIILQEIYATLEWARSANERREITNLNLKSVVTIANLNDNNAAEKIQDIKAGEILLLITGPLPQIIFDALYSYSGPNLLLQVREGASSFASLIQTGKPHFRCGGVWELGTHDIQDKKLKQHLEDASQVCGYRDEAWDQVDVARIVGEYILDAQDSNSSLSNYFRNLSIKVQDPNNDRILNGLTKGVQMLSQYNWDGGLLNNLFTPKLSHCRNVARIAPLSKIEIPLNMMWINLGVTSVAMALLLLILAHRNVKDNKHKFFSKKFKVKTDIESLQTIVVVNGRSSWESIGFNKS